MMPRNVSEYVCGVLLTAVMLLPVVIVLVWLGSPA